MTTVATPLAEKRRALREQLGLQRLKLAHELAPDADAGGNGGRYPRSITMRWLIQEPELVTKFIERILGARVASAVPAALAFMRFLRSTVAS